MNKKFKTIEEQITKNKKNNIETTKIKKLEKRFLTIEEQILQQNYVLAPMPKKRVTAILIAVIIVLCIFDLYIIPNYVEIVLNTSVSGTFTKNETNITQIKLDNIVSIIGNGAEENGKTITITKAGRYVLSGNSEDEKIVIDAPIDEEIIIDLNNLTITSNDNPLIIKNAKKVSINIKNNTTNHLSNISQNNTEYNSTIYSNIPLTITGQGTLNISSTSKGIKAKSLIIDSGTIKIESIDNGIETEEELIIQGSTINISSNIKSISSKAIYINRGNIIATSNEEIENISEESTQYVTVFKFKDQIDSSTLNLKSNDSDFEFETTLSFNNLLISTGTINKTDYNLYKNNELLSINDVNTFKIDKKINYFIQEG